MWYLACSCGVSRGMSRRARAESVSCLAGCFVALLAVFVVVFFAVPWWHVAAFHVVLRHLYAAYRAILWYTGYLLPLPWCCGILGCSVASWDIVQRLAVCCGVPWLIGVFTEKFGWVGFLAVCCLDEINPNPRKNICCGKTWPQMSLLTYFLPWVGLAVGWRSSSVSR